jgi:hypothetical protein
MVSSENLPADEDPETPFSRGNVHSRKSNFTWQLIGVVLFALSSLSQQAAPGVPPTGFPGLDQYRASRIAIYSDDFGERKRYRDADAALAAPAAGESRVVFLGDSITDLPGKPYINRGIDGQTTPQMLVRFRQDVMSLHPAVLVVLGGTNDLAGVTEAMPLRANREWGRGPDFSQSVVKLYSEASCYL